MSTDALNRRKRNGARQPKGKNIVPTERDFLWLKAINEHGPLPTTYLHAFTEHLGKDATFTRKRLRDLYHENGWLVKADAQRETEYANANFLIYGLSPLGVQVLKDEEMYVKTVSGGGPFKHRCMASCVTASIELAVRGTDVEYIPQHEVLAKNGATLNLNVDVPHPTKGRVERHDLKPDAIFGLKYKDSYRFFFVEADRATERVETTNFAIKSFQRNFAQYRQLHKERLGLSHFGISSRIFVLNVTTKPGRMKSMMEHVEKISGTGANSYMLFQTHEQFGIPFKPREPITDFFEGEWHRVGHPPLLINTP